MAESHQSDYSLKLDGDANYYWEEGNSQMPTAKPQQNFADYSTVGKSKADAISVRQSGCLDGGKSGELFADRHAAAEEAIERAWER